MMSQTTKLLRSKPRVAYCGLTIILSNPSRFDTLNLLSSTGGILMNNHCLRPELNVMQCDIRLMEDTSPWLPNTKAILLLGEAAMHHYCKDTLNNTLNEMRGSPLQIDGIAAMASFYPQDAASIARHEQRLNHDSKEYDGAEDEAGDEDEDEGDVKAHSRTKRANYAFWLRADTKKLIRCIFAGGKFPSNGLQPTYRIYPAADEVISILLNTKGGVLTFDIETDYLKNRISNASLLHLTIALCILSLSLTTIIHGHMAQSFTYFVLFLLLCVIIWW